MAEEEQTEEQTAEQTAEKTQERAEEQSTAPEEEQPTAPEEESKAPKEEESKGPKNTVTIEEAGPCKKKVSIEIHEEKIKNATDEKYKELRKEALVPGFRKGRAPRRLLEKRFGKETTEQIKLKLLIDASDSAVKDNELQIIGEPDIDFEKIEMPDEGPMKFDFEVEVRPDFDLPQLKGIPVTRTKLEVTDEQIDREIERLQRWSGIWTPRKDGAVEPEDQIIADALIKVEGTEEEQKLDNIEIYVRPNGFVGQIPVEKLDELLAGAKAGDTKQISVDVPKTYFREEYRGKKVDVQIEIKDIKWLKPAELDENFLTRIGVENENELREKTQDMLQSRLETQVREEMTEQIHQYLLDKTDFDLPLDIVAQQSETLLQRQYTNLMMRGLPREQLDEQIEQLQAASEEQAREQLKTFFIMDKVADKLEIEVSDEEINGHIAQIALKRGQRPERMREQMERDGSLAQFKLEVRQNNCISKLLETAKITEKKPDKKAKKARKTAKKLAKKTAEKPAGAEKKQPKKSS
ncbi:MAG TPA: trigger factor [Sedimentisphaerales bacterium]|nr:trigger factor [Sedimentisphaerales bacterium]